MNDYYAEELKKNLIVIGVNIYVHVISSVSS